ncbi:MAG: NADH-quinone oxidoreductase subunit NuoH [Flavobacteriales bacterium]|nr:NADH-quinone oxidoreductase subunit NuoH [Flavobacteriales bacterium]
MSLSPELIYSILLCVIIFTISLAVAAYATWGERKFAAILQDRVGPSRAGPFGLLQPLADGVKMFMKEEMIPSKSNKWLFILGPSLFMLTACMVSVVIPWGGNLTIGETTFPLQITDINIGILYMFGVVSMGIYGIMIGGWASNNKYSLLGALRASSQMISYEIAMGLAIIALVMLTGSLSLKEIVAQQDAGLAFVVYQPLGFLIFIICSFAETNRAPFDLAECESELVGGYHTEYSSMKLGLFLFAEYINMFISSAVMATLYFGGYNFPFQHELADAIGLSANGLTILQTVIFFGKVIGFILLFMWVRWTLPRFRYDQLMNLGWKVLLPLAIANIFITGLVMYFLGKLD